MLGEVAAHDEPEHECGQHCVPVRGLREDHQHEQAGEDELDLRLDHAVAVAPEEPRRDPRQHEDEPDRGREKEREPRVRLDEDRREGERGAEVGDEGRAHQQLPDAGVGQSALDEHGVHDRERRCREGRAGDQRGANGPVEEEVRDERGDDERPDEGRDPEGERGLEPSPHVRRIDLHPGEEGEHDRREGGDEVEPRLRVQPEGVAGDDAEGELDQRDGDPGLDRDDARQQNHRSEHGGKLNRVHR